MKNLRSLSVGDNQLAEIPAELGKCKERCAASGGAAPRAEDARSRVLSREL